MIAHPRMHQVGSGILEGAVGLVQRKPGDLLDSTEKSVEAGRRGKE